MNDSLLPLRPKLLLQPMPARLFVPLALAVLLAGAAYCLGYEALQSGRANWPLGLIWSGYGVLPWLFLFELTKRWEWEADRQLSIRTLALLLTGTAAGSLLLEFAIKALLGSEGSPFALQIMRRLPAIAATLMLMMLARREQRAMLLKAVSPPAEAEMDTLRRHAPAIRFIRAADNYLELHLEGRVWTRRITIREAAAILEPLGFVRIHRSFIVNRDHVAGVVRQKGGRAVKTMDGTLLPTGKAFSGNLLNLH